MPSHPDALDAQRASTGDVQAFERLYWRHAPRIQTLSRRMLGPDEAADGVQEVFVRAWRKLEQFRGEATFGTWLYGLALSVLLRRAQQVRRVAQWTSPLDAATEPGAPMRPEITLDVMQALAMLPPDLRTVVVLHDMEGHTHVEIAHALEITVSASKMRLHRARTALRAYIGGEAHE